jgi:hypothetical protein
MQSIVTLDIQAFAARLGESGGVPHVSSDVPILPQRKIGLTANGIKEPPYRQASEARCLQNRLAARLAVIIWREQNIQHSLRVDHEVVHDAIVLGIVVIDKVDAIRRTRVDVSIGISHQDG